MDPAAAKLIGAGLAAVGTGAAAIGVGNLFGQFLQGALRNPSAADGQFARLIFGFAVTEALGIFAVILQRHSGEQASRIISLILVVFWLLMGIGYHLLFFTCINTLAYAFGLLLLAMYG